MGMCFGGERGKVVEEGFEYSLFGRKLLKMMRERRKEEDVDTLIGAHLGNRSRSRY